MLFHLAGGCIGQVDPIIELNGRYVEEGNALSADNGRLGLLPAGFLPEVGQAATGPIEP